MPTKQSGTLVVINPDGTITRTPYDRKPELRELQTAVGGLIERVRIRFEGRVRDAFVNEEGLLHSLADNPTATKMLAAPYNYAGAGLVGPLAVFVPSPKV